MYASRIFGKPVVSNIGQAGPDPHRTAVEHRDPDNPGTAIRLSTLNVKNVRTNQLYTQKLLQHCDILCLQEHWLFNFQLDQLKDIDRNFTAHSKAVDWQDPISPLQVPRGYGGNAILVRRNWNLKTTLHEEGCDRIVVMEIAAVPRICIISTYLPCRGNTSKEKFVEVIQEIEELLEKYSSSHAVFVCGDFNSSLSRQPPNDRDTVFGEFVSRQRLHSQQRGEHTFFHASGDNSAELDYILKNDLAVAISSSILVEGTHPCNVSDHIPISTKLNISYLTEEPVIMTHPKPNWAKCNKEIYRSTLSSQLDTDNFGHNSIMDDDIQRFRHIVTIASISSIPGFNPSIRKKKRPPKPRGPEIQEAARLSKEAWWKWKCGGAPIQVDHPLKLAMKMAKRNLRRAQRSSHAEKRRAELESIMQSKDNDAMFHKLIRRQRTTNNTPTNCLFVDNRKLATPEEITEGWATHFERLATPTADTKYDDDFLDLATDDIESVRNLIHSRGNVVQPTDIEEVKAAVKMLNNNKAADYMGLTAEHLKFGGDIIYPALVSIINGIFAQKKIPHSLKSGTITPIFKKGDNQYPDNYRGITVTSIILKVLEHILNTRHRRILLPTQSKLQTGFTKGTSSMKSALLVTECQLEAKSRKDQIILITLDTRKAFDVVNHQILLRNLLLDGVDPDEWAILQDMYTDMTSSAKWQGKASNSFNIRQGVRQGGVLSTEHYKRYNNPLLLSLEDKFKGARIGCIAIPHTTCADDLALLSHSDWEAKLMLRTVEDFSRKHRYDINPTKSGCIVQNAKSTGNPKEFALEGVCIPMIDSAVHLGIHRDTKGKARVEDKIKLGRRTAYSLMGAGLNGKNGIRQDLKAHIWTTYVIPRLLYGLEVLPYNQSDVKALDSYQTKTLRQIQYLADRTATVAATALLGILPITTQLHKNTLNLFYSVIQNPDTVEYRVAERQLALKTLSDQSFFSRARRLLLMYDLPDAYKLITDTPDKATWKNRLRDAVDRYTIDRWRDEIQKKSSLKYLNPYAVKVGHAHHIYTTVRPNQTDVRRAEVKAKLLTGTYTLQSNRAVFNQHAVDPKCKLCNREAETRTHFISKCPVFTSVREKYRSRIHRCLLTHGRPDTQGLLDTEESFTQLVLDCTHPNLCQGYQPSEEEVTQMELLSREFIWSIHLQRSRELAKGP